MSALQRRLHQCRTKISAADGQPQADTSSGGGVKRHSLEELRSKSTPNLWFKYEAEEKVNFYVSLLRIRASITSSAMSATASLARTVRCW
jgi:hypothetical protein